MVFVSVGLSLAVGCVMPAFTFLSVLVTISLCWFAMTRKFKLPFRMPETSNLPDFNDPRAGSDAPGPSKGIAYLGNEISTRKELWFKNDVICAPIC